METGFEIFFEAGFLYVLNW